MLWRRNINGPKLLVGSVIVYVQVLHYISFIYCLFCKILLNSLCLQGRYAIIIFEDMQMYLTLNQWNREIIDKYCRDFNTGMVFFTHQTHRTNTAEEFVQVRISCIFAIKTYINVITLDRHLTELFYHA